MTIIYYYYYIPVPLYLTLSCGRGCRRPLIPLVYYHLCSQSVKSLDECGQAVDGRQQKNDSSAELNISYDAGVANRQQERYGAVG